METDADGCRLPVPGEWVCNWAGPGNSSGEGRLVYSFRFTGEFHCGAWPEQLVTGTPVGGAARDDLQMFVGGEWDGLLARFRELQALPPGARDTGFRLGARELWLPAMGDNEVYVPAVRLSASL